MFDLFIDSTSNLYQITSNSRFSLNRKAKRESIIKGQDRTRRKCRSKKFWTYFCLTLKGYWRTFRYFVKLKSWLNVELFKDNWSHLFNVDSPSQIDKIRTECRCRFLTLNLCQVKEDALIAKCVNKYILFEI